MNVTPYLVLKTDNNCPSPRVKLHNNDEEKGCHHIKSQCCHYAEDYFYSGTHRKEIREFSSIINQLEGLKGFHNPALPVHCTIHLK